MQKIVYIVWFFLFFSYLSQGQTRLQDSLNLWRSNGNFVFIIIPAHYNEIAPKIDFAETDSFSLRLWTGSMFGYQLSTLTKKATGWEAHKYSYHSDSSLTEIKFEPNISFSKFIGSLNTIDFNNFISQYEIEGFHDNVDDGTTYTLEIIINNSYKVFQYHSPDAFSDKAGYNKRFNDLINLIENYFSNANASKRGKKRKTK